MVEGRCSPCGDQKIEGGGDRERDRGVEVEGERYWGQDVPFKGMYPVTYFLQLGPTSCSFHHFPIVHSIMNLSVD
jgi:hypothetical protein